MRKKTISIIIGCILTLSLMPITSNGMMWNRIYENNAYNTVDDIAIDSNDNIIIAGYTNI